MSSSLPIFDVGMALASSSYALSDSIFPPFLFLWSVTGAPPPGDVPDLLREAMGDEEGVSGYVPVEAAEWDVLYPFLQDLQSKENLLIPPPKALARILLVE